MLLLLVCVWSASNPVLLFNSCICLKLFFIVLAPSKNTSIPHSMVLSPSHPCANPYDSPSQMLDAIEIDEDTPFLHVLENVRLLFDGDIHSHEEARLGHWCGGFVRPCPDHTPDSPYPQNNDPDSPEPQKTANTTDGVANDVPPKRKRYNYWLDTLPDEGVDPPGAKARDFRSDQVRVQTLDDLKRQPHETCEVSSELKSSYDAFPDFEVVNTSGVSMKRRRQLSANMM